MMSFSKWLVITGLVLFGMILPLAMGGNIQPHEVSFFLNDSDQPKVVSVDIRPLTAFESDDLTCFYTITQPDFFEISGNLTLITEVVQPNNPALFTFNATELLFVTSIRIGLNFTLGEPINKTVENWDANNFTGGFGWNDTSWFIDGVVAITSANSPFEGGFHARLRNGSELRRGANLTGLSSTGMILRFVGKVLSIDDGDFVNISLEFSDGSRFHLDSFDVQDTDDTYRAVEVDLGTLGLPTLDDNVTFLVIATMDANSDNFFIDQIVFEDKNVTYFQNNPSVESTVPINPLDLEDVGWINFSVNTTIPVGDNVTLNFGTNTTDWYWHDGTGWVLSNGFGQDNSVEEMNLRINSWFGNQIHYRFFFHSDDGSTTPFVFTPNSLVFAYNFTPTGVVLESNITWFNEFGNDINFTNIVEESGVENNNTLNAENTSNFETWTCCVTPYEFITNTAGRTVCASKFIQSELNCETSSVPFLESGFLSAEDEKIWWSCSVLQQNQSSAEEFVAISFVQDENGDLVQSNPERNVINDFGIQDVFRNKQGLMKIYFTNKGLRNNQTYNFSVLARSDANTEHIFSQEMTMIFKPPEYIVDSLIYGMSNVQYFILLAFVLIILGMLGIVFRKTVMPQ